MTEVVGCQTVGDAPPQDFGEDQESDPSADVPILTQDP